MQSASRRSTACFLRKRKKAGEAVEMVATPVNEDEE
jgi:hypothetical protein